MNYVYYMLCLYTSKNNSEYNIAMVGDILYLFKFSDLIFKNKVKQIFNWNKWLKCGKLQYFHLFMLAKIVFA